jgi:hypothetical protein
VGAWKVKRLVRSDQPVAGSEELLPIGRLDGGERMQMVLDHALTSPSSTSTTRPLSKPETIVVGLVTVPVVGLIEREPPRRVNFGAHFQLGRLAERAPHWAVGRLGTRSRVSGVLPRLLSNRRRPHRRPHRCVTRCCDGKSPHVAP